ncbi:hypothetical protein [Neisseria sp. HMSC077D05]|uniref:hypothetical protein n=1 Tax=Neisseria sp. HMSC077D05 TaxID=1715079 RepID=UPI00114CABEF|nr:hypothetical protein [Neisseria sp. HMSC077D05]
MKNTLPLHHIIRITFPKTRFQHPQTSRPHQTRTPHQTSKISPPFKNPISIRFGHRASIHTIRQNYD